MTHENLMAGPPPTMLPDEAERCRAFLDDSDPAAAPALAGEEIR